MARFFFHLHTERALESDTIGVELPDAERARQEAQRAIPDLAAEFLREGRNPMDFRFQITDEAGRRLCELPFSTMLRPCN